MLTKQEENYMPQSCWCHKYGNESIFWPVRLYDVKDAWLPIQVFRILINLHVTMSCVNTRFRKNSNMRKRNFKNSEKGLKCHYVPAGCPCFYEYCAPKIEKIDSEKKYLKSEEVLSHSHAWYPKEARNDCEVPQIIGM